MIVNIYCSIACIVPEKTCIGDLRTAACIEHHCSAVADELATVNKCIGIITP